MPGTSSPAIDMDPVVRLKRTVCAQLSGRQQPASYLGMEAQRKQLYELLLRTIDLGEGNSAILVGPPGVGKSMLLKDVLQSLRSRQYASDTSSNRSGNFIDIHLCGLRHTNTRLALRAIALTLLSHSTPQNGDAAHANLQELYNQNEDGPLEGGREHVAEDSLGSVADVMDALLSTLHNGGRQNTSLVFVLDYIDRFTTHHNQTLLYNLFDIVQRAAVPIAVIGVTTRDDIYELFEKRVRSRFSHRFIHVHNTLSFEEYTQTFQALLAVPSEPKGSDVATRQVLQQWKLYIEALCKSEKALAALRIQYELDPSVRLLQAFLLPLISRLERTHDGMIKTAGIDGDALFARVNELRRDEKLVILKGLTSLELALLIAMICIGQKHGVEVYNFEMAYNEYKEFCAGKVSKDMGRMALFSKAVAMKAWERLAQLELVVTAPGNTKSTTKRYKAFYITVSSTLLNNALQQHIDCPTALVRWATTGANTYTPF
eukprot:CFRG7074T1